MTTFLCLFAVACNTEGRARYQLEEAAKTYNQGMAGKKVDNFTTTKSVEYIDDNIIYTYLIDESLIRVAELREEIENKQKILKQALEREPAFKDNVIPLLRKVGGGISIVYEGQQTGDTVSIHLDYSKKR